MIVTKLKYPCFTKKLFYKYSWFDFNFSCKHLILLQNGQNSMNIFIWIACNAYNVL